MAAFTKQTSSKDLILRWVIYTSALGLVMFIGICVLQLSQMATPTLKKDVQFQTTTVFQGTTTQELRLQEDLRKLQSENATLRASLIETQQKINLLTKQLPTKNTANLSSIKKPARVQRIAEVKRAKKKPKIIQISFDDSSEKN